MGFTQPLGCGGIVAFSELPRLTLGYSGTRRCWGETMVIGVHSTRITELDFCAEIAKASSELFRSRPNSPFADARIEGRGSDLGRKDLQFLNDVGRMVLTGEVKLPGTREGRSPYDAELVRDAQKKADDADVQYFFTWNVNSFVLWDRYRQDVPLLDRRVREWRTERYFRNADEVGRRESLDYVVRQFLPGLLSEVEEICAGRVPNWGMPPDDDIFIRSLGGFILPGPRINSRIHPE